MSKTLNVHRKWATDQVKPSWVVHGESKKLSKGKLKATDSRLHDVHLINGIGEAAVCEKLNITPSDNLI